MGHIALGQQGIERHEQIEIKLFGIHYIDTST